MKIVLLEPERNAQIVEIDKGLASMQKVVDGLMEAIYPFDDEVALVCNEEGKLINLPPNRVLYNTDGEIVDVIYGSFFICAAPFDSEEFESLSEEQIAKYYKMFEHPDFISQNPEKESEKKEMKKFVVNYDCMTNSDLAIKTAKDIVEYLNSGDYTDLDTAIFEMVDRQLIYYKDQWELMKVYQTPQDANYSRAIEMFIEELYSIITEEEIEEELDEEKGEER